MLQNVRVIAFYSFYGFRAIKRKPTRGSGLGLDAPTRLGLITSFCLFVPLHVHLVTFQFSNISVLKCFVKGALFDFRENLVHEACILSSDILNTSLNRFLMFFVLIEVLLFS